MGVAVVCCLILFAGCDDSTPERSQPATETETAAASTEASTSEPDGGAAQAVFSIDDVGLGSDGWVTLLNFTDQPQSLLGHTLCQGDDCVDLPDTTIEPGARARVALGDGAGLSGVVVTGAALGGLEASDGEIAMYIDEGGGDQLVNYMEWGSTPHARSDDAVAAGLWVEGAYAPTDANATRLYRQPGGLWVFDTA